MARQVITLFLASSAVEVVADCCSDSWGSDWKNCPDESGYCQEGRGLPCMFNAACIYASAGNANLEKQTVDASSTCQAEVSGEDDGDISCTMECEALCGGDHPCQYECTTPCTSGCAFGQTCSVFTCSRPDLSTAIEVEAESYQTVDASSTCQAEVSGEDDGDISCTMKCEALCGGDHPCQYECTTPCTSGCAFGQTCSVFTCSRPDLSTAIEVEADSCPWQTHGCRTVEGACNTRCDKSPWYDSDGKCTCGPDNADWITSGQCSACSVEVVV